MHPTLAIDMFMRSRPVIIHTGTTLMLLSIVICSLWFIKEFKGKLRPLNQFIFLTTVIFSSVLGARLFHALFERPSYFLGHPLEIFRSLDGMTFYGSFFMGALAIALFTKARIRNPHLKRKLWDFSVLCMALTYGIMRVGCFMSGCCWGRICSLPWAVRYFHPDSVMPIKGIPVHPVQLYDAALGFMLFAILLALRSRPEWKGKLIIPTLIIYPVGRFITESFRGDSFRGEDVILGLSTSQVISAGLIVTGFLLLVEYVIVPIKKMKLQSRRGEK